MWEGRLELLRRVGEQRPHNLLLVAKLAGRRPNWLLAGLAAGCATMEKKMEADGGAGWWRCRVHTEDVFGWGVPWEYLGRVGTLGGVLLCITPFWTSIYSIPLQWRGCMQ